MEKLSESQKRTFQKLDIKLGQIEKNSKVLRDELKRDTAIKRPEVNCINAASQQDKMAMVDRFEKAQKGRIERTKENFENVFKEAGKVIDSIERHSRGNDQTRDNIETKGNNQTRDNLETKGNNQTRENEEHGHQTLDFDKNIESEQTKTGVDFMNQVLSSLDNHIGNQTQVLNKYMDGLEAQMNQEEKMLHSVLYDEQKGADIQAKLDEALDRTEQDMSWEEVAETIRYQSEEINPIEESTKQRAASERVDDHTAKIHETVQNLKARETEVRQTLDKSSEVEKRMVILDEAQRRSNERVDRNLNELKTFLNLIRQELTRDYAAKRPEVNKAYEADYEVKIASIDRFQKVQHEQIEQLNQLRKDIFKEQQNSVEEQHDHIQAQINDDPALQQALVDGGSTTLLLSQIKKDQELLQRALYSELKGIDLQKKLDEVLATQENAQKDLSRRVLGTRNLQELILDPTKSNKTLNSNMKTREDIFLEISRELNLVPGQKIPVKEWSGKWSKVRKQVYNYIFGKDSLPVNKPKTKLSVHHIEEKSVGGKHSIENLIPILHTVHNKISGIYNKPIHVNGVNMKLRDWIKTLPVEERRGYGYKILFENINIDIDLDEEHEMQLHELIKKLDMKTFY